MSQQYSAALLLVIQSVAAMLGLKFSADFVNALITVVLGAWIMYRRYQQGDITPAGTFLPLD